MPAHLSHVSWSTEDAYTVACTCGETLGVERSLEQVMDTLMDHAYREGFTDGHQTAVGIGESG